jgi:hypothetical protein
MYDCEIIKTEVLRSTGAPGFCTARAMVDAEIALLLNAKPRANDILAQLDKAERIAKKGGENE